MGNLNVTSLDRISGAMGQRLLENNMDPGVLRPWYEVGPDGQPLRNNRGDIRTFVAVRDGVEHDASGAPVLNESGVYKYKMKTKELVTNAPALLRREDWLVIDRAIAWQAKQRLKFAASMRKAVPYNLPSYWENLSIQHAVANGDADAAVAMDPIGKARRSRPDLKTVNIPLPIIYSDGSWSLRDLAVSRKTGMPLDTTNIALGARKVGEVIEQLALGTLGTYSFAGGTLYGATNFPNRLTGNYTNPTFSGWGPKKMLDQVLAAILQMENAFYYGPYSLYYSNNLGPYIDGDYQPYYASGSLRLRLEAIDKIAEVTNLDFLTANTILLVQWTPDVADYVYGFDVMAVQWEEQAGLEVLFKIMTGQVPRFRSDYNGNTGVLHLTGQDA